MRGRFGWLLCLALAALSNPAQAGDKTIDVSKGTEQKGEVTADDKHDIDGKPLVAKQYLVKLEGGKSYKIALNTSSDEFDPLLVILNKDGKFIVADDDSGGGLNSLLTFKAPASGTY